MKLQLVAIFSFVALIVAGCGDGTDVGEPWKITNEELLKHSELTCRSSSECPENVGVIFTNRRTADGQNKFGQCTGFLVADNIVATNAHCIPENMKTVGAACSSDDIAIRFTNNGSNRVIFGCKRILKFSIDLRYVDYAYFEIESTGRKPFAIARRGVEDNQPITAIKVTPTPMGGRIDVDHCNVALGSLILMTGVSPWSKSFVAPNCLTKQGNSGSPILNQQGEAVGILYGTMLEQLNTILAKEALPYGIKIPDKIPENTLFSNFSCIENPLSKDGVDPRCDREPLSYATFRTFFSDLETHHYDSWRAKLPAIFVYDIKTADDGARLATAVCVKSHNDFRDYDSYVKKEGVYGTRTSKIDTIVNADLPAYEKPTLDSSYRLHATTAFLKTGVIKHHYSLAFDEKRDRWSGFIDFEKRRTPIDLRECTMIESYRDR